MDSVLILIYAALGCWAIGQTIYANKVVMGTFSSSFSQRLALGVVLGWILIPIALIKVFLLKRS